MLHLYKHNTPCYRSHCSPAQTESRRAAHPWARHIPASSSGPLLQLNSHSCKAKGCVSTLCGGHPEIVLPVPPPLRVLMEILCLPFQNICQKYSFSSSFFMQACGIWKFLGPGIRSKLQLRPPPQRQNAGSFNPLHWGTWSCRHAADLTVPQWELPKNIALMSGEGLHKRY